MTEECSTYDADFLEDYLESQIAQLQQKLDMVVTWVRVDLTGGIGCPFCKDNPRGGEYIDGKYWHHPDCLYERIK